MFGKNIKISAQELAEVRKLDDFDLKMLLSEINDNGWDVAKETFALMKKQEYLKGKS